jgi:hypothetical protein
MDNVGIVVDDLEATVEFSRAFSRRLWSPTTGMHR